MNRLLVYPAAALSIFTITLAAQSPPTPTFEVASVKRNTSGGPMRMRNAPGNVTATNVPVRQLIRMAYQVQDFQIIGAPAWTSTDPFDVDARFDPAAPTPGYDTPAQKMFAMMKSLLRDRFKMVAHTETRELPIYALRLARADGRVGPQLKPAAVDCAAMARGGPPPDGRGGPPPDGRLGGPPPEGRPGGPPPPGAPFSLPRPQCGGGGGFGMLVMGGMPISIIARELSQLTGRPVIDRTGLTGAYDLDLKFTPTPEQLPQGPPPPGVEPPQIDPNGPSLFTALEEQLGLKLDNDRGPVDVVVIERIEPPVEN
jgi:uncharacterized protein (TIGR03435 family)